jgi:MFS superfamily sulfate permease-like transporter
VARAATARHSAFEARRLERPLGGKERIDPAPESSGATQRRTGTPTGEVGGAFGDLGTFLPHVVSALTVGGLSPVGLFVGFGLFYAATGLIYRLPIPVQPMKAVSAVLVTSGLSPGAIAATGVILGVVLLVLAVTGLIERLSKAIPQSVTAGLQIGLGITLALLGYELMMELPWLGFGMLALVSILMLVPRCPATLIALALAVGAGQVFGLARAPEAVALHLTLPGLVFPSWADIGSALQEAVLPQLALTITNAIIVTAALARSLFPEGGNRVTEKRLAVSSGAANLLLAPFGALPMCHGAGGLVAHHRFGARTGAAPLILGALFLGLGLFFSANALDLLRMIPMAAVGALLAVAGADLAISRRVFDARPSCWPVIAAAALVTVAVNPAVGLLVGFAAEMLRARLVARLVRR